MENNDLSTAQTRTQEPKGRFCTDSFPDWREFEVKWWMYCISILLPHSLVLIATKVFFVLFCRVANMAFNNAVDGYQWYRSYHLCSILPKGDMSTKTRGTWQSSWWKMSSWPSGMYKPRHKHHQEFQEPKMEVLNRVKLFWGWVFPYISRIRVAYIGDTHLHFRYLKCLVKTVRSRR